MTFLHFLRLQRGLAKSEAARLVHLLPSDYGLVERGLTTPTKGAAARISEAFGFPFEVLAADASTLIEKGLDSHAVAALTVAP
ncbi:MAG: helix-turn-helix domain-containing protein [Vulcanimicrobiaceae bacterium]